MRITSIDSAIVGHLDILGFREMVRAAGDRLEIARQLDSAIRKALESFGGRDSLRGMPDGEWSVRIFSDCLCASKPTTDIGLLVSLQAFSTFAQEMLAAGFPVRGGVAIGPYSESELMIFSQAQIDAYDLEAGHARNPRIILSPQTIARIDAIEDDDIRRTTKEYLVLDSDGVAFINYLVFEEEDSWLGGHAFYYRLRKNIERALAVNVKEPSLRSKYEWMARFHNWSLRHTARILKRSGSLSEDDVWSFSSLLIKTPAGLDDFASLLWTDRAFTRPVEDEHEVGVDWIKQWPGVTTEDDEKEPDDEEWVLFP